MPPAKLVTLLSRLALSRGAAEPPGEPDLKRFRRLVHGQDEQCPDFMETIRDYLGLNKDGEAIKNPAGKLGGRARQLIDEAVRLLGSGSWGLPAVSIANVAVGAKTNSSFFLLLACLDSLTDATVPGETIAALDEENQRLLVGAITTLAWFAERPGDCVLKLWKNLGRRGEPETA